MYTIGHKSECACRAVEREGAKERAKEAETASERDWARLTERERTSERGSKRDSERESATARARESVSYREGKSARDDNESPTD